MNGWFTLDQACEYLCVSRQTLLLWIKKRGFPATKIGKLWRLNREDIDDWMREYRNEKTNGKG